MALRPRTRRARRLRSEASDAERLLWRALREIKLPSPSTAAENGSIKVRRQHPIGRYIADFAIPSHKLIIEIDGGQHALAATADELRTRELQTHGYRVVRFWNNEVLGNLEGVLKAIVAELEKSPTSP